MSETLDIDPEALLARLAQLDMAACEHTHAKLMAAEAVKEVGEAGRTYQRAARSLRQTLRLLAQLRREKAAAARQDAQGAEAAQAAAAAAAPKPRPPADPDAAKQADLEYALVPQLYAEFERAEAREYEDEVPDYIAEVWTPDFARLPLEAQVDALVSYIRTGEHPLKAVAKTARPAPEPAAPPPELFDGRLAPPRDLPPWVDDDSS